MPAAAAGRALIPVRSPGIVTLSVILGATLQVLDTTMLTVSLPHVQGALSATQDEITWLLASYLIAVAVTTPAVGVLVARFGRKPLFLLSITGFLVASGFSGFSDSLAEMVVFRFVQGIFAAPLVPLSQSILFDVYPEEGRGAAMGWWTLSLVFGMVVGPACGGLITEYVGWRWVFFVNMPIGGLALLMIALFVPRSGMRRDRRFGVFGFVVLAIALVSLQIILSRGERLDWFHSAEIIIAAGISVAGFYVFAAHTVLSPRPFIHRAVFTDRNFLAGQVLMLLLGIQWLAVLVLLPPYVQDLAGYPVDMAGMIMAPTGIGNMISALAAGRMVGRMDTRLPLTLGAALMATAVWRMSLLTPDVEPFDVAALAALHGLGLGLYFVPLTVVTFSTLAPEHRDVGTSLYALVRNFGSSIGASLIIAHIVRHSQANHALLAQHVSPFAESMRHLPLPEVWSVGEAAGLAAINLEVSRQAAALAYASGFQFLSATMLIFVPMLLLIRLPKAAAPAMEAA